MENTLTEFGTTLVLGGFFIFSIVAIVAIFRFSKLIPIYYFPNKTNITKYSTLSAIPVFALCYIFGLLLEDSSNLILQPSKNSPQILKSIQEYTFFPNEDTLRVDAYNEFVKNELLPPSNEELNYFHNSKNYVYRVPEYFKELSKIQDRIFFTRSFCLSILISTCLFTLTMIVVLVCRIKSRIPSRPSWSKSTIYCTTFFFFYVGLFFVAKCAYTAEVEAFAKRVFGYNLSLSVGKSAENYSSKFSLQQRYFNAIKDAEVAEPGEIYRYLVAIKSKEDCLKWDDKGERILVVTWTNWDGYDDKIDQIIENDRKTWVTTVPELKKFCNTHEICTSKITLRLEQLLGLPPNSGKSRFVEMWVMPDDLFRPSPDPEITDSVAELDFPTPIRINDYILWFNNLKNKSYEYNGYPWTRLGYTFDWGGDPNDDYGLSEFVIEKGALIQIESITDTQDYCKKTIP